MAFLGTGYAIGKIAAKNFRPVLKRLGLFSIATILSLILGLQVLLPVREYAAYSTRGRAGDTQSSGINYDEAIQWSLSPRELPKLLIPDYMGRASTVLYEGNDVPRLKGVRIPGYWGDMPFTAGGDYLGILTFILACLGAVYGIRRRNRLIISVCLYLVFAFLLSFGRHLPLFYTLFYNFVPYFNKFRAPAMMLAMIFFSSALLAGFGLQNLFDQSKPGYGFGWRG